MFDRAVLERAHANHLEAFRSIARLLPRGRIEEDADAAYVRTDVLNFNFVFAARPSAGWDRIVDHARRFFRGWEGPWQMLATPEAAEVARPAAERLHLTLSDPVPQMILDPLDDTPTPLPAGVTLRRAEDAESLQTLWAIAAQSFGMPLEAFDPLLKDETTLFRFLAASDLASYLASVDGRPVATAMRFTSHRVAGIYLVCTLPEYRNRGIGAAITLRAARDGAQEGCTISGLQSSAMGFSVYQRIGYRHAFSYTQWAWGGGPLQG